MKKFPPIILFLIIIYSCGHRSIAPSEEYMVLDNVEYVTGFPIEVDLSDAKETGFDVIGLRTFQIMDSILFISRNSSEGFWQFYSMHDRHLLGELLNVGQGPNEFTRSIYSENDFSLVNEGQLQAFAYDMMKGCIYKLDISKSLETEELVIQPLPANIDKSLFYAKVLDDNTILCRELAGNATCQNRFLIKNGQKQVPEVLDKLNKAVVEDGNDGFTINVISVLISNKGKYIVEAPVYLNYLNLYTLDGKVNKTVCIDDEIRSISSIANQKIFSRKSTFLHIKTYDDFFAVSYSGYSSMEEELGTAKSSQIMMFDYDGKPLAVLNLNILASAFDIDFREGTLYAFSSSTDEFVKYEIKELLRQIVD